MSSGEHDFVVVASRLPVDRVEDPRGETSWRTAMAQLWCGKALIAKGRRAEGESFLRTAHATLTPQSAAQPRLLAQVNTALRTPR